MLFQYASFFGYFYRSPSVPVGGISGVNGAGCHLATFCCAGERPGPGSISLGDSGAVYMGLVDGSVVNPRPGVPETSPLPLLLVEKVVDGTCIVKQGSGFTAHLSWTLH